MRFWDTLLISATALLLMACGSTRVLTEVELREKALFDLNATMHALNEELDAVRSQQLLLPKGSPRYLSVGREVALLNEKSSNFALEWEGKQMDLEEARRKEVEAATAVTNAPAISSTDTKKKSTTEPVQTVGDLKLYPFTLTTDADQGTKAVTGEVENTSANAFTDVSVAFNVLDSDGNNVGTVSDQIATLEPGIRWAFKALVLDNAADKAEFLEFKIAGNPGLPLSTPPAPVTTPSDPIIDAEPQPLRFSALMDKAEKGDAVAQFSVGWAYANGKGVQANDRESVKWYRKSAEQNHAKSQLNLGFMYYNGKGVTRDFVLAYSWWDVAASNGFSSAIANLSFVEELMTPEQLSTAKKLSNLLQAEIRQNSSQ